MPGSSATAVLRAAHFLASRSNNDPPDYRDELRTRFLSALDRVGPLRRIDSKQRWVKAALIQNNLHILRKRSEFSAMIKLRSPASNNANLTKLLAGRLMRPINGVIPRTQGNQREL
jgi:hypothetical protein